jgi:hypothetical protein
VRSWSLNSRVIRCLANASTSSIDPHTSQVHIRTVPSKPALANCCPSGLNGSYVAFEQKWL